MFLKPGMIEVLRNSTSPQIISVMKRSIAHARSARPFKSFPYHCESASMPWCRHSPRKRESSDLFREQRLHLRPVLRARLDDARPAHLVGFVDVLLGGGRVEADRLDAGFCLALRFFGVEFFPLLVLR